jgi:lipopolysaccharide transport system ATP-binding protein
MNNVIQFENVSKRYSLGLTRTSLPTAVSQRFKVLMKGRADQSQNGDFWALKDVSFNLHQGQSLALIGPNGAGKTTILKLLAKITKQTSGRLSTTGKLSALIELGAGFHPDLTGRENIYLNGTILGLNRKDIDSRFNEIVDFSELERFIDTPIKRYSSGMAVRLGFAVASCIEPDILLVDEVLAVGDASFQQKCMKRIHALIANGTSIIFVSHNLYLVQAACDSALYLHKGQVKYLGILKEAIDLYEKDLHQERAQKFKGSLTSEHGENNELEITRIDVNGIDETRQNSLLSVEPAEIRIHYNAYQSLGKVQLCAFIVRSDGVLSCMMRTKLDGFDIVLEKGKGVIVLQLTPLQLVGGAYYVEASFLNESDSFPITKVNRSDWFIVKGMAMSYNETSVFEPNTHWEHYKSPQIH